MVGWWPRFWNDQKGQPLRPSLSQARELRHLFWMAVDFGATMDPWRTEIILLQARRYLQGSKHWNISMNPWSQCVFGASNYAVVRYLHAGHPTGRHHRDHPHLVLSGDEDGGVVAPKAPGACATAPHPWSSSPMFPQKNAVQYTRLYQLP